MMFQRCFFIAIILSWVSASGQELFTEQTDSSPMLVERVYTKGLQFLARKQTAEGAWTDTPYGTEPAVVGLAVVAMLAHGDDPNFGPYSKAIHKGLEYILKQQTANGYIGRSMYNHGFGTLALAEAYGMVDNHQLGPALDKAVKLIITSQSKNPLNGWRYSPDSTDADSTVSGAQMVALFAARNAGLNVPEEAIQKGLKFFQTCQAADGGYGYTPNTPGNATRTAIGCLVLSLAKLKTTKEYEKAFGFLQKSTPDSSYPQYYLYYAAQAYFHASPQAWQTWNRQNIRTLTASQTAEGSWEGQFGPTFGTAASLLSMALNYRYLPIYER